MITIVFGKPRAGKTAFMVADAVRFMNYSQDMYDLQQSCISQVQSFSDEEKRFSIPEWAPVESYYIDGFHIVFLSTFLF